MTISGQWLDIPGSQTRLFMGLLWILLQLTEWADLAICFKWAFYCAKGWPTLELLTQSAKTSWSPSCVTQQTFWQLPTSNLYNSSLELSSIGLCTIQHPAWTINTELLTTQTPTSRLRPGEVLPKSKVLTKFWVGVCGPNLETGPKSMILHSLSDLS